MTDYDGYDYLVSYLNGLAWTTLDEPTYEEGRVDRTTTMKDNSIIINTDSFNIEIPTTDKYRIIWTLNLYFVDGTKSRSWNNLDYIIKNILNYQSSVDKKMWITGGTSVYSPSKYIFQLNVRVQILKDR